MKLKNVHNIETEFNTLKELVLFVLEEVPATRDSDTILYLYCCKALGCESMLDMLDLELNIISIHKIRQVIQNKEGRFLPSNNVKSIREERELEIKKYMNKQNEQPNLEEYML